MVIGNREAGLSRKGIAPVALHLTVAAIAFLLLFSRRPDALLNAQFYAEDGKYWYADAYTFGWRCLWMPLGGYLNTLSRLIGLLAQLLPLHWAPLAMNLIALAAAILPLNLWLSPRFREIAWPVRVAAGFLYLALPNSFELHANTTNLHWHLALAAFLVLLAQPAASRGGRIFDATVLVAITLAGPLGMLLLPIAAVLRWRRGPRYNFALSALIPGTLLQLAMIFVYAGSQRPNTNGASFDRFVTILGGQVFVSSLLGLRSFIHLAGQGRDLYALELVAAMVGTAVLAFGVLKGPLGLKLLTLFAVMVFALGLARPLATDAGGLQWVALQVPGCGNRYYYFPMLAFLATLLWMLVSAEHGQRARRLAALFMLVLLPFGVWKDWRYKPFEDLHFRAMAKEFERSAPGTRFSFPLNSGTGLTMELTKR